MAKLKTCAITAADMVEYLDSQSDFAFELRVLEYLTTNGFKCEHSGTYDDPATGKPRQFDIRAIREIPASVLRLSVECKNIGQHAPLLISCVPRRKEEAFHEVLFSNQPSEALRNERSGSSDARPNNRFATIIRAQRHSMYGVGEPVGKACDQISRTLHADELVSSDADVFEKWAQAIASAGDLARLAVSDGARQKRGFATTLVLPVVVVPNERLWVVNYDSSGTRLSDPAMVEHCSFFVGREHRVEGAHSHTFSHLEFVTINGLAALTTALMDDSPESDAAFATIEVQTQIPGTHKW